MQTIALLELALTLLPKVTVGVSDFVNWISTLRSAVQQSGHWTPEYEAQWRAGLLKHDLAPEEIPDSPQAPV
jgi:hypothetical protein